VQRRAPFDRLSPNGIADVLSFALDQVQELLAQKLLVA
jgi:hypothetical protein